MVEHLRTMSPVTVVLGASEKAHRFSNMAVRRLLEANCAVVAIGKREGRIGTVAIGTRMPVGTEVDTVTLYLSPKNQQAWHAEILRWRPRRVIFNPGTEAPEYATQLRQSGVLVLEACTLVMLATGQYADHTSRLG